MLAVIHYAGKLADMCSISCMFVRHLEINLYRLPSQTESSVTVAELHLNLAKNIVKYTFWDFLTL